jgi:hypothetical protein
VKIIGIETLGEDAERGRLPAPQLIAVCGGWKLWLTCEEATTTRENHAVDPFFVESVTIPRRGFVENPEGKRGTAQYIESITTRDPYWDLVDGHGEVTVRWDDSVIEGRRPQKYPDDPHADMHFYLLKKGMKIVDGKRNSDDGRAAVRAYRLKKGMKIVSKTP